MHQPEFEPKRSQTTLSRAIVRWRAFTSRVSSYLPRHSKANKTEHKMVDTRPLSATSPKPIRAGRSSSTITTLTAQSNVYNSRVLRSRISEATFSSLSDHLGHKATCASPTNVYHNDSCPDLTEDVKLLSSSPIYSGPYSRVYRGLCGEQMVAIKVVRSLSTDTLHAVRRRMHREVETARRFNHPNILPIYGVVEAEWCSFGGIITPWCHNGDAGRYIRRGHVGTSARYELLCGVASGLRYLHDHSVIHGDLKPGNVLIDICENPLIGDFGLARIIESEGREKGDDLNTTTAHDGTPRYLAFELVKPDPPAPRTKASDIHALGCIGYEFLYLLQPYSERSSNVAGRIYQDIAAGTPPATRPSSCLTPASSAIWGLFEQSWSKDPAARPDISGFCAELDSLAGCDLEPLPRIWCPSFPGSA